MGRRWAAVILLVGLGAACGPAPTPVPVDPLATPPAPQAIQAVLNTDLSSYKIRYYQPVNREALPAEAPAAPTAPGPIKETDTAFTIVDQGPVEELPAEIRQPTIYVAFSQPVVPLAKLGAVATTSDILTIDPPLAGVYRWYGTRMLAFESATDALPQKRYTVKVRPDLRSLGGKALEGPTSFTFHTEFLAMLGLSLGDPKNYVNLQDAPPADAKTITIHFNSAVDLTLVQRSLAVQAAGRSWAFTARRDSDKVPTNVVLDLKDKLPENTDVQVTLAPGAVAEAGGLATEQPQALGFHTLTPFRFLDGDTYSYSFPRSTKGDANPVYLQFSHPLAKTGLASKLKFSPALTLTDKDIETWGSTLKINGLKVKYETNYALTIDPSLTDLYGRTLGQAATYVLKVGPPFRYAYFPNQGPAMLEAQFPPKIVWEEQDVTRGTWKVAAVDDPYSTFERNDLDPFDFSKIKAHTKHFEVVDLKPFLNSEGKGTVGLAWDLYQNMRWRVDEPEFSHLTVQVTDLGLTLRYGYNKVVALVTSLSTGKAVAGAQVSLLANRASVLTQATGPDGLTEFTLTEDQARTLLGQEERWGNNWYFRVKVVSGKDQIEFAPNHSHNVWRYDVYQGGTPVQLLDRSTQETFLFSDRKIYRPGETLTFRAIDRTLHLGKYEPYQGDYTLELVSPFGERETVATTSGTTTESGGLSGSFNLGEGLEPGDYSLVYQREGSRDKVVETITINFFRRLMISASLVPADRPWFAGDDLSAQLSSEYLSGGFLGGAPYEGYWNREPTWFRPEGPRWSGWSFGPYTSDQRTTVANFKGTLSAAGSAAVSQNAGPAIPGLTYVYTAAVNVTDPASNQLVSASTSFVVHPALFYIGAKLKNNKGDPSSYVEKGQPLTIETILARPDGSEAPTSKLSFEVHKNEWKEVQQQGVGGVIETRWNQVDTVELTKEANSGEAVSFTPKTSGSYYVLIKGDDAQGRTAVTQRWFYATGGEWVRWYRDDDAGLGLIPDQPVYKPGDTAHLVLQSPLPSGTYLVTVEREGILDKKLLTVKGSTSVIDIPITEAYLPIVYVAVSSYSVRQGPPVNTYYEPDLGKPRGYFGIVPLRVESSAKKIDLKLTSDKTAYRPGDEAEVTIQAFHQGKPLAGAEITYMAVDRGVVDLINYHVPDPVAFFYDPSKFPLGVQGADSRSMLIDPVTYQVKDQPGGDSEDTKLNERKDFRPTAIFEPFLKTDAEGKVKVKFKMPDSLTTYRTTAVAVKGDLFGMRESDVKVQNPINMRAALPRKLRQRDTAYAGVIVTNLDTKAQKVTVACASDLVTIDKETSKTLSLESGQTAEFAFFLAAEKVGTGEVAFTMTSDLVNEKLRQPFEVEKPVLTEAVATIGKVTDDQPVEEGLILPSSAVDGLGSLTLTLDATRVGNLHRAFSYTFGYPYGCLEQRSSRLLPLVVFGDYIEAFGIESKVVHPKEVVEKELAYILANQNSDGGFPVWPGYGTNYYVSIRVAHLLWYALQNGYKVPDRNRVDRLLDYLDNDIEGSNYYWHRSDWVKLYSLYVQALHGRSLSGRLAPLAALGDKLGLLGYGMLGLAYENSGQHDLALRTLQRMKNFLRPSTRSIDLTDTEEAEWSDFEGGSGVSKLAVFLMLLQKLDPQSDMVQRTVTSLTDRQRGGIWHNTDDTTWALQALAQIIKSEESGAPNFQAKVSLGPQALMSEGFQGIKAGRKEAVFDFLGTELKGLPRDKVTPLHFEKAGPGTLFYTAQLRYAIPVETSIPRDEGLGLFTEVTTLEGQPAGQNLVAGQIYRMKATLTSSKDRAWVAVRLPIPSGAEVLDAKLSTGAFVSGSHDPKAQRGSPGRAGRRYSEDYEDDDGGWWGPAEHQEIFDNEVRFFFDAFDKGTRQFEFLFRAVNQGVYPVPPATAECMYQPEIFGRDLGRLMLIARKP